jgi:apolipoprotein N-acyltransferase
MGVNELGSLALSTFCWLFVSTQQGIICALFAALMRLIPMCGGAIPRKVEDKWKLPAMLVVPILWQAIFEKIGNAHDLLGVPWSMIEYTQYKQTAFVQIASIIGGIGVGAIVVAANVALAIVVATFSRKFNVKSLAATSRLSAVCNVLVMAMLVSSCIIFGMQKMHASRYPANTTLSILQGNINIEMQKTTHHYTLADLAQHYSKLLKRCKPGICVWTESALPTYLKDSPNVLSFLEGAAREKQLDMVVGSIDSDDGKRPYNSAFGITSNGNLLSEAYHKRFLVPVGEYTPAFVKLLPDFIQRLTDTPAGEGFAPGTKPVVLDLSGKKVAPLICFETIAPELVTSSVRNGGEIIVNISDLAWFHNSMIGDQTSACAIFRALESGRYFIYAANTGPSLVINPLGVIEAEAKPGEEEVLTAKVAVLNGLTPFSMWYH